MKKFLLVLILTALTTMFGDITHAKNNDNFRKSVSSYVISENNQITSVNYSSYLNTISETVRKTWKPQSRRNNLNVVVIAVINNSGSLRSYKVIKSSGNKGVDFRALAALQVNSPYDAFPKKATEKCLKVKFVFNKGPIGNNIKKELSDDSYIQYNNSFNLAGSNNSAQGSIPYNYNSYLIEPTKQLELNAYSQLIDNAQMPLCKEYLDYITSTMQKTLIVNENTPVSYFRFNIKNDGMVENVKLVTSPEGKLFAENIAMQINSIIFNSFPPELKFKNNKLTVEYKIGNGELEGASFTGDFTPFTIEDVEKELNQTQPKLREVPIIEPITEKEFQL